MRLPSIHLSLLLSITLLLILIGPPQYSFAQSLSDTSRAVDRCVFIATMDDLRIPCGAAQAMRQTVEIVADTNALGVVDRGDRLRYTVRVSNTLERMLPQSTFEVRLDHHLSFLEGTLSIQYDSTELSGVSETQVLRPSNAIELLLPVLQEGDSLIISFEVQVLKTPFSDNEAICSQAFLSAPTLKKLPSDDPEEPGVFDPTCIRPGIDSDGDGVADPLDGCPNDPDKIEPGNCGCGVPETDADSDGVEDCIDGCPTDPHKIEPGLCGCGISELDLNGDGVPDECGCPDGTVPGVCGCGASEEDSDDDGVPDCVDQCPLDPDKITPGVCGCGVPETDSDGDGFLDCIEDCPLDPYKIEPGFCGCGIPETDTDSDGTPDCVDLCPENPLLTEPAGCGGCTGSPDTDSDGDGICDPLDGCPEDPNKTEPGVCGCGIEDSDVDGDGVVDCLG